MVFQGCRHSSGYTFPAGDGHRAGIHIPAPRSKAADRGTVVTFWLPLRNYGARVPTLLIKEHLRVV